MAYTPREEILAKNLKRAGLYKQVKQNSTLWHVITDCMQESAAHEVEHALIDQAVIKVPPETVYVKYDTTKESIKTNDCVHYFLNCGYGVQVCDYCTAFKMI